MKILRNKIQCLKCKQIIESHHDGDEKFCKCNTVSVSGGKSFLIRGGLSSEYTELSELEDGDKIINMGKSN